MPLPSYLSALSDSQSRELVARALLSPRRSSPDPREWALSFSGRPVDFIGEVMGPEWWTSDWTAWRALTKAIFAVPMDGVETAAYRECTGRDEPPDRRQREAWVPVGRRGGKSRWSAMVGVYLACCEDHTPNLAPGEWGHLLVLADSKDHAQAILGYVKSALEHPRLRPLVIPNRDLIESVDLLGSVRIAVSTASIKAVRSRAVFAALCDEIAFWPVNEESANPDVEIVHSLTPAMLTFPGRLLIGASSPYARKGVLWDRFRLWHGRDGGPLVWRAPTTFMHPSVDREEIDREYETDPASAAAEYGAEFRSDVAAFVSYETVYSLVMRSTTSLPPTEDRQYHAFVDPSGGNVDSMTLAIAHRDPGGRAVLDLLLEERSPLDPIAITERFCEHLRRYGVVRVNGDHYGGEWPSAAFRERGVLYEVSAMAKSDIYQAWLPLLSSGSCDLLDDPRLISQAAALERRTSRGGRDTIDHPPKGHDDVVNAAAGALVMAAGDRFPSLWTAANIPRVS